MPYQWVSNVERSKASVMRFSFEAITGKSHLIGRPQPEGPLSANDLETMNFVGIYMTVPDEQKTGDPKCPYCKGTGKITLLTSIVPCECVKPSTDVFPDDPCENWE
jgi:hypothetical protein